MYPADLRQGPWYLLQYQTWQLIMPTPVYSCQDSVIFFTSDLPPLHSELRKVAMWDSYFSVVISPLLISCLFPCFREGVGGSTSLAHCYFIFPPSNMRIWKGPRVSISLVLTIYFVSPFRDVIPQLGPCLAQYFNGTGCWNYHLYVQ